MYIHFPATYKGHTIQYSSPAARSLLTNKAKHYRPDVRFKVLGCLRTSTGPHLVPSTPLLLWGGDNRETGATPPSAASRFSPDSEPEEETNPKITSPRVSRSAPLSQLLLEAAAPLLRSAPRSPP